MAEAEVNLRKASAVPRGFAELLFQRTATEDLARLAPATRAALAAAAWEHLQKRADGGPDIRIADLAAEGAAGPPRTVVEIVNEDRPFLLDSTVEELTAQGFEIRLIAHPVLAVTRDGDGRLTACQGRSGGALPPGAGAESLIHLHVTTPDRPAALDALTAGLAATYRDVIAATTDWRAMRQRLKEAIAGLADDPPPLPAAEIAEAIAFLRWLDAENFTFLGMRDYAHHADGAGERLDPIAETGLGILRDPAFRLLRRGEGLAVFTPEVSEFLHQPVPLIVTKASVRSRVHRRVYLDYVGLKLFDADGGLAGEMRLVGLFTHTAYTHSVADIPLLRRKAAELFQRTGFRRDESSGRALTRLLEGYPRDELFQIDTDTLFGFAREILSLYERPRIRVLTRIDRFDRFVSLIAFVPRERYDSALGDKIGAVLAEAYGGHLSAIYPAFPEGVPLTRLHIIVGRSGGATPRPERAALEKAVAALVRSWPERLRAVLAERHGAPRARRLAARYAQAFDLGYQDAFTPEEAAADIARLERLGPDRPLAADFAPRPGAAGQVVLKLLARGRELPLAERVPMLDRMGIAAIDERTFAVTPGENGDRTNVWLHDMVLEPRAAVDAAAGARLEELFIALVEGRADGDGYNALVLLAGLGWRDVAVLQAVSRYLRQALIPFGQDYMAEVLGRHPAIAAAIVGLFRLRFDPEAFADMAAREAAAEKAALAIEADLAAVESLDEDRILRRFLGTVQAMTRTNFFQTGLDGAAPAALAFKVRSAAIEGLPAPKPLFDLFVHSPRFEGIHLRFGRVARGGIRWSDRPQDFRTEILGLVKAQQVKNAVIVPVGAKGGFVPLKLPAGPREAVFAEGTAVYRAFIATLLDLTDNLDDGKVVPPRGIVRYDGDDPYLVVAADKGTATFSDTANAIAAEHGFWLDDAFASGGSEGYDHKDMGITARGAWESVKRHFREKGVDVQTTPFTMAGVGDMSGDVFGNGALQSQQIRLVAAFDHRDIFIDPDPDPAATFAERRRLFALPRSSWADYNREKISAGGGVFARGAKVVPLSPEARTLLGITAEAPTPQEVVAAILRLDVDLLWFGGIGTFVRSSEETNADAGDRANDQVRIAAADLRARVIGEGANLGMTQRGRIEAARRGIALNTDAIDNSAGVNTSDMEVNIKIALAEPVRQGRLPRAERNALLHGMTEEVAALVLRNNYEQTLALSLTERRGLEDLGFEGRLMQVLEGAGRLDRAVEFLPDEAALAQRLQAGAALTRPELAVLLAYAKAALFDDLLESAVPDDAYFDRLLMAYFPAPMPERFRDAIEGHRLRREIVATALANLMINRGGPSLVVRLADQSGAAASAIAAAFALAHDGFRLDALNADIDALDGRLDGGLQLRLYAMAQDLLLSRMGWFLRHVDAGRPLAAAVARFRDGIDAVRAGLDGALGAEARAALRRDARALADDGVPEDLALRFASLPALRGAPDAVLIAEAAGCPLDAAAATLFAVADALHLDALRGKARSLPVADYYERLALDRALSQIGNTERALGIAAARAGCGGREAAAWLAGRTDAAEARRGVERIVATGLSLAKLSVAAGLLGDLVGA